MSMLKGNKPLDWWIKWVSSAILIVAMGFRATVLFPTVDLVLSLIGIMGWFIVGIMWKDNALIILNGASMVILMTGVVNLLVA